ncbi:hypothetical protein C8J56DRAFT_1048168 [Mycena floridula]|nr:hypothetical protein C8J56DRAFT_1048168 [Mycena floridula]
MFYDSDEELELSLPDLPEEDENLSLPLEDEDMFSADVDFTSPVRPIHVGATFTVQNRRKSKAKRNEDSGNDAFEMDMLDVGFDPQDMGQGLEPSSQYGQDGEPEHINRVVVEDDKLYDDYEVYQESVFSGVAGFHRIGQTIFLVREWNPEKRQVTKNWLHLTCRIQGDGLLIGCLCQRCQIWLTDCVHKLFFKEYKEEKFGFSSGQSWPSIENKAVLVLREPVDNKQTINTFSVGLISEQRRVIKGCGKKIRCDHVRSAQDALQRLVRLDPDAKDDRPDEDAANTLPDVLTMSTDECISKREILPPEWSSLSSDKPLYERTTFGQPIPDIIPMDQHGSCLCTEGRWDPFTETVQRKGVVYGLYEAKEVLVEVQKCSICPSIRRRYVGPDTRDLRLLNYNNSTLFTHELLEDYCSAFTTSETPFVAWVTMVSRRYHSRGSPRPFVEDDLFRSAWFAYAGLLQLGGDMQCSICGPFPRHIIWDGVSIAISKKYLNDEMRPPTICHEKSVTRENVRNGRQWHALLDPSLRLAIRDVVKEFDTDDSEGHWDNCEFAIDGLFLVNQDMSATFEGIFGHAASEAREKRALEATDGENSKEKRAKRAYEAKEAKVHHRLFEQIAAEESILQMITKPGLVQLHEFNSRPCEELATKMLLIPALMNSLELELRIHDEYGDELLGLCHWLELRATTAYADLVAKHEGPLPEQQKLKEETWKKTGCCYSMPQLRHRPRYPRIKNDQCYGGSEKRGGNCSKYYARYGKNGLTGGIMAPWCTHSIAYGFHCIPIGEGRNDVFAAMVTRWPKAPEMVVYDFACALGPYCMAREPQFFADTQFVIDTFHTSGHKKCSHAAFLQTYTAVDPRLQTLNSSAAECGNGVLTRIRKSVSYMVQRRAIIYMRTFICLMNRIKLRKLSEKQKRTKGTLEDSGEGFLSSDE